jgi:hypothetical protein
VSIAPETIYLQWIPEKTWHDGKSPAFEVTWCEDQINDDDIEYVKAEILKRLDGHICHHADCVSWQDDDYCDCAFPQLLEDLAKETAEIEY